MLYYSFTTESEPKVIGVKDGMSQVVIHPKGYSDAAGYYELERFLAHDTYWQRASQDPPRFFTIEYAELRSKARLTDFLKFSPFLMACPFMLSERAKAIFTHYYIQPSFLFDAFIYNKSSLVSNDYSLFYNPYLGYEVIDFAKSRFRINLALPFAPEWKYYTFNNVEEYLAFCDNTRKIPDVESLVMSEAFNTKLDFFKCRLGPMYMSERLKNAIEESGLTGVIFPLKTGSLAFSD